MGRPPRLLLRLLAVLLAVPSATGDEAVVAYADPLPADCRPMAVYTPDSEDQCTPPDLPYQHAPVGSALRKRRHRLKTLCRETHWIVKRAPGPFAYMHMTSLALMPDGKTVMVAFQASSSDEGHSAQRLVTAVSHSLGRTWVRKRVVRLQDPPYAHAPVAATDWYQEDVAKLPAVLFSNNGHPGVVPAQRHVEERPLWGPALFNEGGRLWMFFSASRLCWKDQNTTEPSHWTPGGDVLAVSSADGDVWSNPTALLRHPVPGPEGGAPFVTANPPAVSEQGHWVLPFWAESPKGSVCEWGRKAPRAGVLVSKNRGHTWTASQPIRADGTWLIEGTVVPLDGGELLQLFRTTRGHIYQSRSLDGGMTWSTPDRTGLPNPNSKVAALALSNGELLLAYNAHRKGGGYPEGTRALLFLATSATRGASWHELAHLEMGLAPGLRYHYPSLLQVRATPPPTAATRRNIRAAIRRPRHRCLGARPSGGYRLPLCTASTHRQGL